ncbi:interleukin-4 [Dasypus novemcinctus]|uniref:interleukin-4 n=1 Tax=Dasypus novemcinctus TaxID=9361 RepID=UPI0039C9B4FB
MGLTFQLIPTLLCLLACTSAFVHGLQCNNTLKETIKLLNNLTEKTVSCHYLAPSLQTKHACTKLLIPDAFAAWKSTTENETFCRVASVLQKSYNNCTDSHFKKQLKALSRSVRRIANMTNCPMNEAKTCTLKDLLERLKMIMKEKYSKCQRIF